VLNARSTTERLKAFKLKSHSMMFGLGHGLVTRTRSSADKRQVHVSLTDAGLSLREPARHTPPRISNATGLALQEMRRVAREIKAVRARLEAHSDTNGSV
jgi:hypothetical protein